MDWGIDAFCIDRFFIYQATIETQFLLAGMSNLTYRRAYGKIAHNKKSSQYKDTSSEATTLYTLRNDTLMHGLSKKETPAC